MHHEIARADVDLGDLRAGLSQKLKLSQGCPAEPGCEEPGQRVLRYIYTLKGQVACQFERFQGGYDRGDAQVPDLVAPQVKRASQLA